ncbi:MAG: putative quinol monooxygenase [Steroidobacteraceae bacterium]
MRIHAVGITLALFAMTSVAGAQAPRTAPAHHGAMARGPAFSRNATAFFVVFKVKPGKDAEFEQVFRNVEAKVLHNEPGNLSYDLYRNGQPHTYVIVERYKNPAAVAAHGRDARNLMTDLRDSLDGPPKFQALTLVSSK